MQCVLTRKNDIGLIANGAEISKPFSVLAPAIMRGMSSAVRPNSS